MTEHTEHTEHTEPARPDLGPTPAEIRETATATARTGLRAISATVTQREWLQIARALDRTRDQIGEDSNLTMLALGWVKAKQEHGGASWDKLLDLTDAELAALHGFPAPEDPEE